MTGNNELGRIEMEAVVTCLKVPLPNSTEGTEKNNPK
jgi:hypothetical protein